MNRRRRPPARPRLHVEELEPRVLYSADAALLLDPTLGGLAEVRVIAPPPVAAPAAAVQALATPATPDEAAQRRELVVVDARVADPYAVLDALARQRGGAASYDLVVLDADRDSQAQLAELMAQEQGLAALHLVGPAQDAAPAQPSLEEVATLADGAELIGWQAGPGGELLRLADPADPNNPAGLADPAVQPLRSELVFIDARVADIAPLLDELVADRSDDVVFEVIRIDASRDGLTQISAALAGRTGIDALHLISHGASGQLLLGSGVIDAAVLADRAGDVSGWRTALSADADLLLYGCDVAATPDGQGFAQALADLSGADVAASADTTGSAERGGDWVLEYRTGQADTAVALDAAMQSQWAGVLAITGNGTVTSAQTGSAASLTWSHTVASGTDRALFVELAIDNLGANVTGVTYGGQALTQVGRTAANHAVEIWVLVNPTVGTANIVASFAGTTAATGGATAFNGVNQSTPAGTYAGASGIGNTASVTVSSAVDDLVIDAQYWDGSAGIYTLGEGQTQLWTKLSSQNEGISSSEAGAASVTMTGTSASSSQWEIGAVSIKAASTQSLAWNSFAGGAGTEYPQAAAVDSAGNVYVVGHGSATWGAPVRAFSTGDDAFVAKFDSSGNLLWNTFLGGAGTWDHANGITVDASGNVYVTGESNANWGSPVRAYTGGNDAFVAKLNGTTGALTWNTFLGSGSNEWSYGIAVDGSGNVYVDGASLGSWGSPVRAFTVSAGNADAFVAKLNSSGVLTWNTFLGGTGSDGAQGLALDGSGNVYVAGYTGTASWGSPLRAYSGGFDTTAAKLNGTTGALTWNTFMGGAGYEVAQSIALDGSGNLYLSGYGDSTWGSPIQAYGGGVYDASVIKLTSAGALSWNTFLGGSGEDRAYGIAADSSGNVDVAGYSGTTWGSPWRAYSGGGQDAFVAQLTSSGSRNWNAFFGTAGTDQASAVAVDGSGNIYLGGNSAATWGSPVRAYTSGTDGFVTKISSATAGITVTPTAGLTTTEAGGQASFTVVLNSAPSANVSIAVGVNNPLEATVSTLLLTFTPANWATPQTVTVTGAADLLDDGNQAYTVVLDAASSADGGYSGLDPNDVTAINTDVDTYNTIVVTTAADTNDGDTSSLYALLRSSGADGKISLREAITAANNTANGAGGADRIYFNIAGGGPHSISVTAALPTITQALIIDGSTEPDFAGMPVIELNGAGAGAGVNGLSFADGSDGSTIRGLAINRFTNHGIYIAAGADGNTIAGNFIGTDVTGTLDLGNTVHGVSIYSNGNTVGGNLAADRNILSGNDNSGVRLTTSSATNNLVIGNFVGTDVSGTVDLGNTSYGVVMDAGANNNTIGGTSAAERNVISGNNSFGVRFGGAGTSNNVVQGNYIGTDVSGALALGNSTGVVNDNSATSNRIGGVSAGAGNLIAYNTNRGVAMVSAGDINNPILGNAIHSNGSLAIDLGSPNGVTLNDAGDADTGSNNYQNFPVLTLAKTDGAGSVTVSGTLNSTASSYYRIEFFANTSQDSTGYGEGQRHLGYLNVATDASGNATLSTSLSATVAAGEYISATATKSNATYSVASHVIIGPFAAGRCFERDRSCER